MVMPSPRSAAQQIGERLLLKLPQAGGRLVQDHDHRIGGERARHFEQALLAERQIAGEVAELLAEADALQLMQRLGARGAFLGAVEPQRAGEESRARARIGAEQHVVDQRHVRPQLDVLERPRHALGGDVARRQCGDVVAEEHDPPGVRLCRAGDQVEQRGLAGAIRADQAEDLAGAAPRSSPR